MEQTTPQESTVFEEPARISRRTALLVGLAALVVLSLWYLGTPPGITGKAAAVGYAICHQIPARSFFVNTEPMPLCARCTGIYLGVITSLLITVAAGRTRVSGLPPLRVLTVFGLFVVAIAVDGVNSYLHLFPGFTGIYSPHNVLRLATGMGAGIAMFHLVFPVFNAVIWQRPHGGRILNDLRELLGVLLVALIVILLVLSERPLFLLVLGLLSTTGVAVILTMVGTVLFLSFSRRARYAVTWRDLLIPLLAGLTLAFVEIGAINALRFWLTGTWQGFVIGS